MMLSLRMEHLLLETVVTWKLRIMVSQSCQDVIPLGTSVLFDGNTTPTLTGLDGDMWASQLLVLRVNTGNEESLVVDFADNPDSGTIGWRPLSW